MTGFFFQCKMRFFFHYVHKQQYYCFLERGMKRSSLNFDHLTTLNMIQYQVITIPSFPQSLFISSILKRVTQRVPLVEQKLLTLTKHLSSLPFFNEVLMLLSCSLLSLSTIICLIVLFLLTICIVLSVRFYQSSMCFR